MKRHIIFEKSSKIANALLGTGNSTDYNNDIINYCIEDIPVTDMDKAKKQLEEFKNKLLHSTDYNNDIINYCIEDIPVTDMDKAKKQLIEYMKNNITAISGAE